MNYLRYHSIVTTVAFSLLVFAPLASGYEVETHREITGQAATQSTANNALINELGLSDGLLSLVGDRTLRDWMMSGAISEDDTPRYLNHFHNPLTEGWFNAGFGGNVGQSSIIWGQNSDPINGWAWQNVRAYYLTALRASAQSARATALRQTFEGIGHLVHLVQDAASPAHTKNDPHIAYNYEKLVRDVQRTDTPTFTGWLTSNTLGPDPTWQSLAANAEAPIPPARLIDTDIYTGANPADTVNPLIGLAEYTNANYFSEDRIFTENDSDASKRSPYPRRSSVVQADFQITLKTGANVTRAYYLKVQDGETGYRLATVDFLTNYLQRFNVDTSRLRQKPALDESVYRDYASRLVPKAVAYSAALMDYFLRGRLELSFTDDPANATQSRLRITNRSSEALGAGGQLTLYTDNASGDRPAVATLQLTTGVPPNQPSQASVFVDPLLSVQAVTAVYQGPLGGEHAAVVAKVQPSAEVEELFKGSADWMLRTASGVFPLGIGLLPTALKWGDADNLLVAETFVSGSNDRVFSPYRINRPVGSRAVPLNQGVVDLIQLGSSVRLGPDPIDLGTTVHFRRKITFGEELTVLTVDTSNGGDPGAVVASRSEVFTDFNGTYPELLSLDRTFSLQMPLTLPNPPLYQWSVLDFYLDRNGHVLVSVVVQIQGISKTMPMRKYTAAGALFDTVQPVGFSINLLPPSTSGILFLVDVTSRTVVLKSSEDGVDINYESLEQESVVQFYDAGTDTYLSGTPHTNGTSQVQTVPAATTHTIRVIPTAPTMTGLFRHELLTAGFGIPGVTSQTTTGNITNVTGVSLIESDTTVNSFAENSMGFQDMRRSSSVDNSFALIGSTAIPGDTTQTHVWAPMFWMPGQPAVTLLPQLQSPVFSSATVADTGRSTMMIFINRFASPRFTHTHFSSAGSDLLFTVDLRSQYHLMEPNLLFNLNDIKFHRINSTLDPLPAPLPLFVGPGVTTVGQYHANGR
jgi:hypothetical protein